MEFLENWVLIFGGRLFLFLFGIEFEEVVCFVVESFEVVGGDGLNSLVF